jgi:uncharacterized radical SAM superfamily protein
LVLLSGVTFDIIKDGAEILSAPTEELDQWISAGLESRLEHFGNDLFCFSPTGYPYRIKEHGHTNEHSFISLSVTGLSCSLGCEHCNGRLLKGMVSTTTPEALFAQSLEVKERGGLGVLISGGSDSEGHVPLDRFISTIRRVKEELDLQVVVHTGLVTERTAGLLASAGIDSAMLDIIGDETVAKRVYHIDDGPAKMARSLDLLSSQGIPIAPHLLVGINYGLLGGELEALAMISGFKPQAVVIIALSPLRHTGMEGIAPPSPELIGRILTVTRHGFTDTPVLLGCARPIGQHKIETDIFAVRSGVNGIAYISQEGVDYARRLGLSPVFKDVCCSLVPLML